MRKGEKESRKKKEQFLSFCLTSLKKTNNSMNSLPNFKNRIQINEITRNIVLFLKTVLAIQGLLCFYTIFKFFVPVL